MPAETGSHQPASWPPCSKAYTTTAASEADAGAQRQGAASPQQSELRGGRGRSTDAPGLDGGEAPRDERDLRQQEHRCGGDDCDGRVPPRRDVGRRPRDGSELEDHDIRSSRHGERRERRECRVAALAHGDFARDPLGDGRRRSESGRRALLASARAPSRRCSRASASGRAANRRETPRRASSVTKLR